MTTLAELILADPELEAATLAGQYQAVADKLNERPMVDNPVSYKMVPKPVSLVDVFGALENGDKAKVMSLPGWFIEHVERSLSANDRDTSAVHLALMSAVLTAKSQGNIQALMGAKIRDPSWEAKVPGDSPAMAAGLGTVKASDVQAVAQSL